MSTRTLVRKSTLIFTLVSAAALQSANPPGSDLPQYIPTCPSPQPSSPPQMAGGQQVLSRSAVAWNGREYGVVWLEGADMRLHFRRFFADGSAAGPVVNVGSRNFYSDYPLPPALVWNGTGYAVAWSALNAANKTEIFFARLTPDGGLIGSDTQVSFVGQAETANAYYAALAWSGDSYAVAWEQFGASGYDILATLLNSDGTIANSGTSHDLVLSDEANSQMYPSVTWSASAGEYIFVWQDGRAGSQLDVYGAILKEDGTSYGSFPMIYSGSLSTFPQIVDGGGILGLVWDDNRDGSHEIYFARFTSSFQKIGPDIRLTNTSTPSLSPWIAWTGAEFGIVWRDNVSGAVETWFQRMSVDGVPLGDNVQVSHAGGVSNPAVAFGRYGYLVTYTGNGGGVNRVQAWGCNSVSAPPSCAGGYVAYGISGTNATVGWLPADAPLADIAYYNVYRNAVLVGKTSATAYNDSGLSPGVTYAYSIQPVDSFQNRNSSCTAIIYVRSNASLTLKMDKSNLNAILNWTDAGLASYNIFRGTDPRVMQQIGATPALSSSDANALTGPVNYFYTVDDPGM